MLVDQRGQLSMTFFRARGAMLAQTPDSKALRAAVTAASTPRTPTSASDAIRLPSIGLTQSNA